jgi:lambda family phage tail tape measure protein
MGGAQKAGQLPTIPTDPVVAPRPGSNPAIKGTAGIDRYAEALRKILNETEALTAAQKAYNDAANSNLPTAAAERLAKHLEDIAKKQNDLGKGLTPAQADDIDKRVEGLAKLQFSFEELKRVQREGDQISRQYGDGQTALAETMYALNEARKAQVITEAEYNNAVAEANERQREQALLMQKNAEGLEGIGAGWSYAQMQMEKSTSAFAQGQQLFTGTVGLMSAAIEEFVETGEVNFEKLFKSFAAMLAKMAAEWAAQEAIKAIIKGVGSIASSYAGGTSVGGTAVSGGMRAAGGPVLPGYGYTVGEAGPERFVPNVPGNIEPATTDGGTVIVNVEMRKAEGARDPASALEMGRKIKAAVMVVIEDEKRPGGALYHGAT